MDYATKNNAPGGVIAIVDEGGNLMALERLDGTFAMVQVPHVANDHRGFFDVPALRPFADVKDRRVRFGSDAVAQDH